MDRKLAIENEILRLEIRQRDKIIRHKNREIDALRTKKTVYKHEMNCLRKKISKIYKLLNNLIIDLEYNCMTYETAIRKFHKAYDLIKHIRKL